MRCIRQLIALCLCLVLCPVWPALAQIEIRDIPSQSGSIFFYRISDFRGALPPMLQNILAENNFADASCYIGVMLEELVAEEHEKTKREHEAAGIPLPDYQRSIALVALERKRGLTLVGLHRNRDTGLWTVEELGSKMLLPGRDFTIEIRDIETHGMMAPARFCTVYQTPGGGTEAYGFSVREEIPWHVKTYEKQDAEGKGFAIVNANSPSWLHMASLPVGDDPIFHQYTYDIPLWATYMKSIADFPTTQAHLDMLTEESQKRLDGSDLALTGYVNLRTEPTTRSVSRGYMSSGTLVHVLGEKQGTTDPWYHVRVGNLEGWIAGNYVGIPYSRTYWDYVNGLQPVARTTAPCTLRAAPGDTAAAVVNLTESTLLQVVLTADDGWLYVIIPGGDRPWRTNVDGVGGYVRTDEVVQGITESLLPPVS